MCPHVSMGVRPSIDVAECGRCPLGSGVASEDISLFYISETSMSKYTLEPSGCDKWATRHPFRAVRRRPPPTLVTAATQ